MGTIYYVCFDRINFEDTTIVDEEQLFLNSS
jgi:hypothetical protein